MYGAVTLCLYPPPRNDLAMTPVGPLLGVATLGIGLAAIGTTIGSPLIVGVAVFSALLAVAPLLVSVLIDSTAPVESPGK